MADFRLRSAKTAAKTFVFFYPLSVVFIKLFGGIYRVDGCSMQPCLNPGAESIDWVYVKDTEVWRSEISRGDVVTVISPRDPEEHLIKRVIALEGDVVVKTQGTRSENVKIPAGHCWVEGDHTNFSKDSNLFGPVSMALVKSKALYVIWPPSRWQRIPTEIPPGRQPLIENSMQR